MRKPRPKRVSARGAPSPSGNSTNSLPSAEMPVKDLPPGDHSLDHASESNGTGSSRGAPPSAGSKATAGLSFPDVTHSKASPRGDHLGNDAAPTLTRTGVPPSTSSRHTVDSASRVW